MEPSLEMKRPFVQKSEWEGSALEWFKSLKTLLITFKALFLKALLKELHTPPLFKSIASNRFWSQRLKAKLYIHHRADVILLDRPPVSERPIHQRCVFHCQALGVLAVLAAFLATSTEALPRSCNPGKGQCIFTHIISASIGKPLAQTSCLVIFRLTDQASPHRELYSRRQSCFSCEMIRVPDRHSWFFPSQPKGAHKRSPKSTKHCSQQLLKF